MKFVNAPSSQPWGFFVLWGDIQTLGHRDLLIFLTTVTAPNYPCKEDGID